MQNVVVHANVRFQDMPRYQLDGPTGGGGFHARQNTFIPIHCVSYYLKLSLFPSASCAFAIYGLPSPLSPPISLPPVCLNSFWASGEGGWVGGEGCILQARFAASRATPVLIVGVPGSGQGRLQESSLGLRK